MKISYYKKHVYGVANLYIVDGDFSDAVRKLTGKKTINKSDMKALELFGAEFVEILEPCEAGIPNENGELICSCR